MKVRVKRWHGVSIWKWDVPGEEVCGICRMPYESCCPGIKYPGDDCPPVWGIT
jgi:anaphase-promoting complex subunit 11